MSLTSSKYGIKNESDSIILNSEFDRIYLMNKLKWASVKKDDQYGVFHFDGHWVFPLDSRKVYVTTYTDSTATLEIEDNGYKFVFNENFELLHEKPVVFFETSYYNWNVVPDSIRPLPNKIRRPLIYQEYIGFNDGTHGHIFSAEGKYISSHPGYYDENYSLVGLGDKKKYSDHFIPVGKFTLNKSDYYIRLTDGFEYKK